MEDIYLGLMILGSFWGAIFGAIYYKRSLNPVKKAQKRNEMSLFDNLTGYREVEKSTIADILKQKDNQIKSLNARIKLIEPFEEENSTQKGVTWEEITTLVHEVAPQYAQFLPFGKKQIMQQVKGMTMQEIIELVKSFTGNKKSQGFLNQESVAWDPNSA